LFSFSISTRFLYHQRSDRWGGKWELNGSLLITHEAGFKVCWLGDSRIRVLLSPLLLVAAGIDRVGYMMSLGTSKSGFSSPAANSKGIVLELHAVLE
jgi:hypothetical protein